MEEPFGIHGYFQDAEDIFSQFGAQDVEGIIILFAAYYDESYEGEAWVLFERDNKLFEVNGSHCSCMGLELEDQWSPEEITVEALRFRLTEGNLGVVHGRDHKRHIEEILDWWENEAPGVEWIKGNKKHRGRSVLKFKKFSDGNKSRKVKYTL